MTVNYAPLLNAPDIGQQFALGRQQGRDLRLQGQRDSALQALSANPNDPGAINSLMAVDPRTALLYGEANDRRQMREQEAQRGQAFAQALGSAPGVPDAAREYVQQTGDAQGAQQLIAFYAQAGEQEKAAIKDRLDFLANNSPLLKQVADPNQRLAAARQLAQQNGLDPNAVTPDTVTDMALDGAASQALGLKGQLDQIDKQMGRQIQVLGIETTRRGQDISQANTMASIGAANQRAVMSEQGANARFMAGQQSRGPSLTPAQKSADGAFAKEYASWAASGGSADTRKQLEQLRWAQSQLASGKAKTGGAASMLGREVRSFVDRDSMAVQEAVEETVQRNLRLILGAQFTEKEGDRLIARSFNPRLSTKENARRLGLLITQIETAAGVKDDAARYYEANGTIAGWQGRLPTATDFDKALTGRGGNPNALPGSPLRPGSRPSPLKSKYGLE